MVRHLNLALKNQRFLSTKTSDNKTVQRMGRIEETRNQSGKQVNFFMDKV